MKTLKGFLFSLCLVFIFADIVTAGDGCRDLYYLPCENDKAFLGHVIKTFIAPRSRRLDCMHMCYIERDCVSYNLGPEDEMEQVCNLSRTDHVEYPDDVKDFPGAKYCPVRNYCAKKPCPSHQTCKPDFDWDTHICLNKTSCADLKIAGKNENGVYNITPVPGLDLEVYCDQETDGGGWTVIQKRINGSVDFYRGWDDYKRGFGNKSGEYWLGLEAIHILTNREENELRVDMEKFDGNEYYAAYKTFKVGPESQKYTLGLGSYKGTADDSFKIHNGMKFSTRDQDNDKSSTNHCAQTYKGAWWFKSCLTCHLNAEHRSSPSVQRLGGISWKTLTGYNYPLKKAAMKIRPAGFYNA